MSNLSIDAYVRIGATKNSRLISFNAPPDFSQQEALAMGFAIDGDALLFEVSPVQVSPDGETFYTIYGCLHDAGDNRRGAHEHGDLVGALRCTQLSLVKFFGERACGVNFE